MARLVKVWGPGKRIDRPGSAAWVFSAMHEDGRSAMYRLQFYYDSRKFRVIHLGNDGQALAYSQAMHTLLEPSTEVAEGKVTDILKARLPPAQLAAIAARAVGAGES